MRRRLFHFVFAGLILLPFCLHAEWLDAMVLTNIAARHKLPQPPSKARLVLAHTETWGVLGNESTSRDPGIYSPAFLLEEQTNGNVIILRGTEQVTLQRRAGEPLFRPFSTARVEPKRGGFVVAFDYLSAFVCSVQLARRGEAALAQEVWNEFRAADWWSDVLATDQGGGKPQSPPLLLARCLYDHLRKQVLQRPGNWPETCSQLSDLFTEFPSLKTGERKSLFDGLAAAIAAKPPIPGSVEALLLDWSQRTRKGRYDELFENPADAPARDILLRGMDAVPELAGLLNDRRISAHEINIPVLTYYTSHIQSVGELAAVLLGELAGLPRTFSGEASNTEVLRSWLGRQDHKTEEAMLAEAAFTRHEGKITGVNETSVRVLSKKFPRQLLELCEEFSRDATVDAHPYALAEALASADLPREIRVKALVEFAQRGSLLQRRCVLQCLAELDGKKCAELLDLIFDRMPKDADGPYWKCPEAEFTHVVMQIEEDAVWRNYAQVVKRSSIGLRMEMLGPLDYAYIGEKNRARRLALLAMFLNDKAMRNDARPSAKYDGPSAAFEFHKISVRNFAAMQIATILGFTDAPDEFWSSAEWDKLRAKVRARLAAENLPNLSGL